MVTVQIALLGGVQINSLDVTFVGPMSIKISWDYHPAAFIADLNATRNLANNTAHLHAHQEKFNKECKAFQDCTGGLGDSEICELAEVPAGEKVSVTEGFINPFAFLPPCNDDPLKVKTLNFNHIDNTSTAVNIGMCLLLENA